jgi:hypothetical protein
LLSEFGLCFQKHFKDFVHVFWVTIIFSSRLSRTVNWGLALVIFDGEASTCV